MRIRTRLSLWHLGTTFVLLILLGTTTFFGMRHMMFRALDREHEVIALAIEGHFDITTGTFRDIDSTPYHVNENLKESYIIVYDSTETQVYRSPVTYKMSLPISLAQEKSKTKTIVSYAADQIPAFRRTKASHVRFLAVSRKLYVNDRSIGWLAIATPIGDIEHSVRLLLFTLLSGIVMVSGMAGVWSYYLTRKSLEPVAKIAATARKISTVNFGERITVDNWDDEVGHLAQVLNELADRIQKAFDSQQQFVADGAHELKTPLTVLRTHWEDELNNPDLPVDVKEKLVGDVETISRLTRVINNLLLLSQTEFAHKGFDLAPVALDELVGEVVSETEVLAGMKSQQIGLSVSRPAVVRGDRDRLYQLVFNLVDNAVKYTPEHGKIAVALDVEYSEAVLRIEDNGDGISVDDIPRVFDRFYRVSKDRSHKTGGSGLGLSICKMIAESHGGSLVLSSKRDEGSTFTVRIPLS